MKAKLLLATIMAVFLAASVATTQIHYTKAATTRNITLYGSYAQGWSFTTSITNHGPLIVVEQGDTVNLTLISEDSGIQHKFFVSYANASLPNSTDPQSSFTTTAYYQFVASNTVGTFKYGCANHPTVMWGYFQVVPTGTIPEFQPLIMLSLLVASTAVAALVYRRKR
jgi:hypothetical protein